MKNIKFIIVSIVLFVNSCSVEPAEENNDYKDFIIRIDKITASDTISVTDSLTIKFDGVVGTNGCNKFKYFEVVNKLKEIHITVWGTRPNYDTVCPTVMVYLNGKEYKTKFEKTGLNKIVVHQPDNSTSIDSVFVQ